MKDDDLRAIFKQEETGANIPAFSAVLNRATPRYRPRRSFIALVLLIAVAVPVGWFASERQSVDQPAIAEISVPTTDWLLAVAEPGPAPEPSSHESRSTP
jgi:hypothetical protein